MRTLVHLPEGGAFSLEQLVKARPRQVCSMELSLSENVQLCIFAFDGGEGISEEAYPGGILYYAISGEMSVCLDKAPLEILSPGSAIWVGSGIPHSLDGKAPYQLLQIMINQTGKDEPNMYPFIKHLEHAKALPLKEQLAYEKNQVVSLTLTNQPEVGLTLFSFDAGTKIGPHAATGDAMPMILEGQAEISIGDETYTVNAGESIVMPANLQHSVKAITPFKMLLIVVKPGGIS